MFPEQKSSWQPTARLATLHQRAAILRKLRDFFATRQVLEVETPLLCQTSVPDPFIESIPATVNLAGNTQTYYLQTSPEYAMKRLLAAGAGSIYQICKAFRQDEAGSKHNLEFTLLEWYRVDFDHHQLMDEMDALLNTILQTPPAIRLTYRALYQQFLMIDPQVVTLTELKDLAKKNRLAVQGEINDKDTWLDLLMTHCIEPAMSHEAPYFVYDFPCTQAALARIQPSDPPVASRFEVYFYGMELANGFHELQNADEQRQRFTRQLEERRQHQQNLLPLDERLLDALHHGLPACAGVALGVDRLVMLATGCHTISEVLSFDISKA